MKETLGKRGKGENQCNSKSRIANIFYCFLSTISWHRGTCTSAFSLARGSSFFSIHISVVQSTAPHTLRQDSHWHSPSQRMTRKRGETSSYPLSGRKGIPEWDSKTHSQGREKEPRQHLRDDIFSQAIVICLLIQLFFSSW